MHAVYIVRGQSMRPRFQNGDLVVVRTRRIAVRTGDVVVYREPRWGFAVVHRVVAIGVDSVVTMGDAVGTPDPHPVPKTAIEGVVRWRIPKIGALLAKLQKEGL